MSIFTIFKNNSRKFIVNQSNALARQLSQDLANDFAVGEHPGVGYIAGDFNQQGFNIQYSIGNRQFSLNTIGKHNMENALAGREKTSDHNHKWEEYSIYKLKDQKYFVCRECGRLVNEKIKNQIINH